jgi:hypothetical protein
MGVATVAQGSQHGRLARINMRVPRPLDPAIEALRYDRVAFAKAAGITLDSWQADLLSASVDRFLLNCSRQTGKSFVAAVIATHQAIFEPRSLAVVVAVAQRQALEMIRVCRTIYSNLGRPIRAEAENKLSLELANGSRILSIPSTEATVRGLSKVGLLIMDEASRIPDELYAAVLPFLAVSNGKLALLSTPFGRRGFFFDAYQHRDEWRYVEVRADQCPRISPVFLAEQRRKMGEYFFAQEWECQFNDSVTGAFRSADIDRAVKDYPTWNLAHYDVNHDAMDESVGDDETWNLSQYATP